MFYTLEVCLKLSLVGPYMLSWDAMLAVFFTSLNSAISF